MMRRHSPYNYAFNNPVYFIDPDGMFSMPWGMSMDNVTVDGRGGGSGGGGFDVRTYDGDGKTLDFVTVNDSQGVDIHADGSIEKNNYQTKADVFNSQLETAFGDKVNSAAPATDETVDNVISNVPIIKNQHDGFNGEVNINIGATNFSENPETEGASAITYSHNGKPNGNPHITLFRSSFNSYKTLATILFHEFIHVQDFRSGQINRDFIRLCGGNVTSNQAYQSALYLSEIRAYREGLRVTGQPFTPGYSKAANYLTKNGINF